MLLCANQDLLSDNQARGWMKVEGVNDVNRIEPYIVLEAGCVAVVGAQRELKYEEAL